MSLRPVFGRSSRCALSWISFAYLSSMSIAHDGVAVLEVDRADLADLDAGDLDRLALARGHGLGGAELGVQLVEVLAEDREPAREGGLLVVEDDEQGEDRDHGQRDDRQEVPEVVSDRLSHGYGRRARGARRRRRAVEVGNRVLEAGDVGLERRQAAERRAGPERRRDGVAEELLGVESRRPGSAASPGSGRRRAGSGRRCRCRRSSGRLAGDPGRRVEELAVVRLAGAEVRAAARVLQRTLPVGTRFSSTQRLKRVSCGSPATVSWRRRRR